MSMSNGYGDRAGYARTTPAVPAAAHARDDELRKRGVLIGIAGRPVQIRNPDAAELQTISGSLMSSPSPVAGFAVIAAGDMPGAIFMVSHVACDVVHGVVEVWPSEEA